MDYEKKYKEALERARELQENSNGMILKKWLWGVFPELKESEDERIIRCLLNYFNHVRYNGLDLKGTDVDEVIAWLEKQNPVWSEEDEGMLKWLCRIIHTQRLDRAITLKEESELGEWMDKWLNHNPQPKQCEHLENYDEDERVRKWLEELIEAMPDNSIEFKELKRIDVLHWLEKQGEKVTNINGEDYGIDGLNHAFHVGEWITNGDYTWKIVEVKPLDYILQSQDGNIVDDTISYVDEHFHLWTIEDAKDGNVLNSPSHRLIWIYKDNEHYHVCVNMNYVTKNIATDGLIKIPSDACPATKDERTILFEKTKEAGYEWDADKKELKKIEPKKLYVWNAEDEQNLNVVLSFIPDESLRRWLKDKLCYDTLDADKVIEWLKITINERAENYGVYKETRLILPYNSIEDLIKDFKEDFGLC